MKTLEVAQLAPGLWRWTVLTPAGPLGSVYYEPAGDPGGGVVVIDPIVPETGTPEERKFWGALDGDVERLQGPVRILVTTPSHRRSAREILERYAERFGAEIVPPEALASGAALPDEMTARSIEGRADLEVALFIPRHRALILGEALVGAGDGRVEPARRGWIDRDSLVRSVRGLEVLEPALLVPSHGPPVLDGAGRALARATASGSGDLDGVL